MTHGQGQGRAGTGTETSHSLTHQGQLELSVSIASIHRMAERDMCQESKRVFLLIREHGQTKKKVRLRNKSDATLCQPCTGFLVSKKEKKIRLVQPATAAKGTTMHVRQTRKKNLNVVFSLSLSPLDVG